MKLTALTGAAVALVFLAAAAPVSADIAEDLAHAVIIEDFQFNDAAGTPYNMAANSAGTGNLISEDADLDGVVTNGVGALDLSTKNNNEFGSPNVDSRDIMTGRVLGVMEATWDFTSPLDTAENEELRISLLHEGTSTVTAQFDIQRNDDDQLEFFGTALGTGAAGIDPVILNGGSLAQSMKFIGVVDADLDNDTFFIHYSTDGGASFQTLGPGVLDPERTVDKLRLVINNDFIGDSVLIDRVYMAAIPEPASAALILIGFGGLAASWRRRR